nr:ribonuclease H-like domain-containing protein [Tanacetum cinerariifolium]
MHDTREHQLVVVKRIIRYVQGTLKFGLQLYTSSGSSLMPYSGTDSVGFPVMKLNIRALLTLLLRQWLHNLLQELHTPLLTTTLVYYDNVNAVYLFVNVVHHEKTKYIDIAIYFVSAMVATGHVRVLHVPSRYQCADIVDHLTSTDLYPLTNISDSNLSLTSIQRVFKSSLSITPPKSQQRSGIPVWDATS